jgi:formylmethanofuran dehydrogenase subunit E
VASPATLAPLRQITASEPSLDDLVAAMADPPDLVLAEGFHDSDAPYLLLLDRHPHGDRRSLQGQLLAVIGSDDANEHGLKRSDPIAVAEFIRQWLGATAEERQLDALLAAARAFHGHMCPGQILGVRLAVLGCRLAGVPEPRNSKQLVTWVEIDRCGADAVQTVTGCKLGKRSLKFVDNGKLAATFLNTNTGAAFRVVARADSRERAADSYPNLERHEAQMRAYRELPESELFDVQRVEVELAPLDRPGKPVMRVRCSICAEEVNDGRHVEGDDGPVCRDCAGTSYFRVQRGEPTARVSP